MPKLPHLSCCPSTDYPDKLLGIVTLYCPGGPTFKFGMQWDGAKWSGSNGTAGNQVSGQAALECEGVATKLSYAVLLKRGPIARAAHQGVTHDLGCGVISASLGFQFRPSAAAILRAA